MGDLTLSEEFDAVVERLNNFHRDGNRAAFVKQYNDRLDQLKDLDNKVDQLHLFSSNEPLDDISTDNLKFLAIPYHLAHFMEQYGGVRSDGAPDKRSRLVNLLHADSIYMGFLHRAQDYGILTKAQSELLDSLKENNQLELSQIEIRDPVLRRQRKIENYKKEKAFREALEVLKDKESMKEMDDEVVRNILQEQLQYYALKSFEALEGNVMELELLKNATRFEEQEVPTENDSDRERKKQDQKGKFDKGFTDKVESIDNPVFSDKGRVLRPFTIVPAQTREQIRTGIQGTGQKLPTMTVEEFVDHELKNGGMVSNTNEHEDNDDKDNDQYQDKETYKQRELDEFKDYHAKGSGNTKGNMG
ncbi:hypothetical protein FOA43_000410 [Brettanomyces nanus]|uniref:Uncharacterized protein n=1 Tax=Eeniella nana TaxID=13502 RepID=A0A875RYH4_EENNA|nr:uncharacterized protein FOA43_000410 [Brettanomyces nanus]QPG73105.1 hypothetical protein FOA43_000410 [Brettanomyces nanus]